MKVKKIKCDYCKKELEVVGIKSSKNSKWFCCDKCRDNFRRDLREEMIAQATINSL